MALQIVQRYVKAGIERIELRDEIFCQLVRQTKHNPERPWLLTTWTLLCLCTAAFSPSKTLNKVTNGPRKHWNKDIETVMQDLL